MWKSFKMREVVNGPKQKTQEAQAIKHPVTGELIVSSTEIKKATLEYCLSVLKANEPTEDVKELRKRQEELFREIMDSTDGHFEVSRELFELCVSKFEYKKKKLYNFLVKAGEEFKEAIYCLCKRILEDEDVPERFFLTQLLQLYKGKGSAQELSNSRFLHLKEWLPRLCEALVVEGGLKDVILKSSTKFQIGGQPGMRTQFHLFAVKSVMGMRDWERKGGILTVADIQKYFDKESLQMGCLALLQDGADRRAVRLWYKLNSRCTITAMTRAGPTERGEAGPTLGQGGIGGSLVSQRYLDRIVNSYFETSMAEDSLRGVQLQPCLFQDDLVRSSGSIEDVRHGNMLLDAAMKEMSLEIHPSKSCYLLYGSTEYKKQVEQETAEDPIMFGHILLQRKTVVTYLGDELSEGGLAESVEATIIAREAKVKGAIYELKTLCEDYRMQVVGGMLGALDIYNTCIVPSLLNNCSVWVDIKEKSVKQLDALQNMFVKTLLHLPDSTPSLALRAITGMRGMLWRIWEEKLLLVLAIRRLEEHTLAREMFEQQVAEGLPGLSEEAARICQEIMIPNVCKEDVSKEEIKEAILNHHHADLKRKMADKEKCKELLKVDLRLASACLAEARMGARVQLRMATCQASIKSGWNVRRVDHGGRQGRRRRCAHRST